MGSSKEPILKTLLYANIFDYPLSKEEIWKFLISPKQQNKEEIFKYLAVKNAYLETKNNLFFIKGSAKIVNIRRERNEHSLEKIIFAKKIVRKLSKIPTVSFIGISGALAMRNSKEDDDIDLFVIAAKDSVWTTRLLMIIVLKLLGAYRRRKDKEVSNKICLNMLIDENALSFPKQKNDLYTAHEIVQIMPIFNRDKTYEKFLDSNIWINKFIPNVFEKKHRIPITSKTFLVGKIVNLLFRLLAVEFITRNIQLWYMKKNITKETVLNNFLAFHPFDYRSYTLNSYKKKIAKYGYSN